ncbi:MAG: hypothetical protein K9L32_07385 [Chromatiaceae bacterium]|nr:hypothetical protein [Chromatiaceae bacterium]
MVTLAPVEIGAGRLQRGVHRRGLFPEPDRVIAPTQARGCAGTQVTQGRGAQSVSISEPIGLADPPEGLPGLGVVSEQEQSIELRERVLQTPCGGPGKRRAETGAGRGSVRVGFLVVFLVTMVVDLDE